MSDIFDDVRPDLLVVTETWLTTAHGDSTLTKLCPDRYAAVHRPRSSSRGGGVAFMYRKSLECNRLPDSVQSTFEYLDLLLSLRRRPIRIVIIYRPPCKSSISFLNEFSKLLDSVILSPARLLIVGDFNYHVDSSSDTLAANFLHLIESYGLSQYVTSPSHKCGHTLDLVVARPSDNFIGNVTTGGLFSDHMSVFCSLRSCLPPLPLKRVTFRSYKSFVLDNFLSDLASLPLIVDPSDSFELLVEQYNVGLRTVLDLHAPLRTKNFPT